MRVTLVSTLPFLLTERKPGLIPEVFEIPAAPKDGISVFIVNDCYHNILIPMADEKLPPMKVIDLGERVARSIIDDYISASLGVSFDPEENGSVPIPGMFFVEERLVAEEIDIKYPDRVKVAKGNTVSWFKRLVRIADDDWQKFHQHKMITDLQRKACSYLGLKDREWNFDVFDSKTVSCWACKVSVHPDAIVCSACKAILNMKKYEEMKGQFVS